MGISKKGFSLPELGLVSQDVYGKVITISTDIDGKCVATLQLRPTKEAFNSEYILPLKKVNKPLVDSKDLPLWEQGYAYVNPLRQVSLTFIADKNKPMLKQGYEAFKKQKEYSSFVDELD